MRRTLSIAAIAVATAATLAVAAPAQALEERKVPSIQAAATALDAPLFAPTFTVGLAQRGKVTVVTDATDGGWKGASVRVSYGTGARTFTVLQNPDFISGALDGPVDIRYGDVGGTRPITARSGERFSATVAALCGSGQPDANGNVPDVTCTRADVRRTGGLLVMTLVTKQANAATITISSDPGISYAQLLRIARGMTKVQP